MTTAIHEVTSHKESCFLKSGWLILKPVILKPEKMMTYADKSQENRHQLNAESVSHQPEVGSEKAQFVNNRPEADAQRRLQTLANKGSKAIQTAQLQAMAANYSSGQIFQLKENNTGLPDNLKSGIENLSGHSMDDVKVHYNSDKPSQLNAHAYAQGTDIHLAPGQERHLPHEAWHVVQQKQGRVKPTMQLKGKVRVNDDVSLEKEADVMGAKAASIGDFAALDSSDTTPVNNKTIFQRQENQNSSGVVQRMVGFEFETGWYVDMQPAGAFDEDGNVVGPTPFRKKDVVSSANHDGFRMEADEAEEGRSELEFVVRPPVAESFAGRARLDTIMGNMAVITGELLARFGNGPFGLDEVTGNDDDATTVVTPRDAEMRAGPQVTTAVMISKIPELLGEEPDEAPENPAFFGLAKLIGQYVDRGTSQGAPLNYPKRIAEPLLSRTNFVGLFRLIEPARQIFYLANRDQWVTDVLQTAGLPPETADLDLLHRGVVSDDDMDQHMDLRQRIFALDLNEPDRHALDVQVAAATLALANYQAPTGFLAKMKAKLTNELTLDDLGRIQLELLQRQMILQEQYNEWQTERNQLVVQKTGLESHAGFTVRDWLADILNNVDRITQLPDAESMGEFGLRTENAGPDGNIPSGIFEWRRDQATKIPPAQWRPYALAFMDRILALHGHEAE